MKEIKALRDISTGEKYYRIGDLAKAYYPRSKNPLERFYNEYRSIFYIKDIFIMDSDIISTRLIKEMYGAVAFKIPEFVLKDLYPNGIGEQDNYYENDDDMPF